MKDLKLTTASYLVLGLVEMSGPVTPYELKQIAAETVINFWSLPHTQIYTQCDRLTEAGLLAERREESGRRRREFTLTDAGKQALDDWRAESDSTLVELRDLAMLKLFFGADPKLLAEEQLVVHKKQLEYYEQYAQQAEAGGAELPEGPLLALQAGLAHEREFVRFWTEILKRH